MSFSRKCRVNKTKTSNKLKFEISFDENLLKKFSLDSKTSIQPFLSQNTLKNLNKNCKLTLNEEFRDKMKNAVKNAVIEYLEDSNNELISSSDKYMLKQSDVCNKMKSSFTCNEIQLKYKENPNSNISSELKKKNSSEKLRFRQSPIKDKINDWEVINELSDAISNDVKCLKVSLSIDNILIDANNGNKFQECNLSGKNNERKELNVDYSQLIDDVKEIHSINSLLSIKKDQEIEFLREDIRCETSKLENVLEKSQKDAINDLIQPENIYFDYSKSNSSEELKEQLKFSHEQLVFQRISSIPTVLKPTTIQKCEKHINTVFSENKSVNHSSVAHKSKSSEINKNRNYSKLPLVSRIPSLKVPRYIAVTDYIFEPFEISTPCDIHDIYACPEEKSSICIEPNCELNKTITCITSSSLINKELTEFKNSEGFKKEKQKTKAFKIISAPPKFSKFEQRVEETVQECHFYSDKLSMIINYLTNKHYSLSIENINIESPLNFSCKNIHFPTLVSQIKKKTENIPLDSFIPQTKTDNQENHAALKSAAEKKLKNYSKKQKVDLSVSEKKCPRSQILCSAIIVNNDFKNKNILFPYQDINESDKKKINESVLKRMNQLCQIENNKNYQQKNDKVRTETGEKSQKKVTDNFIKKNIYEKRNSNVNESKQKRENSKNASNRASCFHWSRPFPIDSWPLYATSRDENRSLSGENKIFLSERKMR